MRYYRQPISPILLRELTSDLANEDESRFVWKEAALLSMVLPDARSMVRVELLHEKNCIPMDGTQVPCEVSTEVNTLKLGRGVFVDEHPSPGILRKWTGEYT